MNDKLSVLVVSISIRCIVINISSHDPIILSLTHTLSHALWFADYHIITIALVKCYWSLKM